MSLALNTQRSTETYETLDSSITCTCLYAITEDFDLSILVRDARHSFVCLLNLWLKGLQDQARLSLAIIWAFAQSLVNQNKQHPR